MKRAVHCKPQVLDLLWGVGIDALSCLSARCNCQVLKTANLPRSPVAKNKIQRYFNFPSVAKVLFSFSFHSQDTKIKNNLHRRGKK